MGRKIIDLTGQKFGFLIVESFHSTEKRMTKWSCRCVCGIAKIVASSDLKSKSTRSCGCNQLSLTKESRNKNREDLTKLNLAYIKPIEYAHSTNSGSMWKCQCICGKILEIRAYILKHRPTVNCGCKSSENYSKSKTKEKFLSCKNHIFCNYKRNARNRDLAFDLTFSDLLKFIEQNCYYCNSPPRSIMRKNNYHSDEMFYNGIDRLNNDIGYNIQNCVTCCSICNRAKSNMSYDDFISWIKLLALNVEKL